MIFSHAKLFPYQQSTWSLKNSPQALQSQSYPFRTLLCPQSYKASSGKAFEEQHSSLPSHSNLGTEEALLQKTSKATCSSPPGVSVLLFCLSAIPFPFIFLCFTSTPHSHLYSYTQVSTWLLLFLFTHGQCPYSPICCSCLRGTFGDICSSPSTT